MSERYQHTQTDVQNSVAARTGDGGFVDPMLHRSADSQWMLEYWDLSDTIVDGINAVRLAGDRYLPKFTDEEATDYEFRRKCTKMTNIFRDTVEGLASKPFEEEISLPDENVPEFVTKFVENVDGSGNNLTNYCSAVFFNGINSAIHWIYVDYPKANPTIRSVADQKRAGVRPYWSHVLGRNVLDVRSEVIGGDETLTFIKILEPGKPDRVREFERLETGNIVWRLFERMDNVAPNRIEGQETRFHQIEDGTLRIDQIPLVPFITGRRDGRTWKFFPAMRDAADLQIELYQQESALKFVKVLAAYPMLAGNGVSPPKSADGKPMKLAIGPARVLYAPPSAGGGTSGSWSFIEPAATTMTFLASDIKDTMAQLRELARQPLTAQMGITVVQAASASGKSKSAVRAWALGLKDAIENALVITLKWEVINYDPSVNVFTEFDEFLEGKDLDALQAARTNKDISQLTYWQELRRRGVLSPEFDADVEEQRLLDELPGDGEDRDPDAQPGLVA